MRKINAFTLIELLVVIAIIGILSALIIVGMSSATHKATIAKAQAFSHSVDSALMSSKVSEWNFNNLSGTVDQDISSAANFVTDSWGSYNGTAVGTPNLKDGINCITGKCLSFNGSTDYVTPTNAYWLNIFNNTINNNWAISVWVKPENIGTDQAIVSQSHGSAMSIFLMDNGKITLEMDDTSTFIGTNTILNNSIWQYIVISFINNTTSSSGKYYINGIFDKEETKWDGSGIGVPISSLWIGWQNRTDYARNPTYFNGSIDDVRIYNSAIPASQIQQNYFAGLNKLFARRGMEISEYQQRITELTSNYAQN